MTKTFASFASFSLAFSLFACGSGGEPAQNSGAGGSTAGTSGARGGSANATGGATTASSGGSTASAGGNTNGTQGGSSSTSMGGASNGSGGSSAGGSGSAQGGATSGGVGGASASGGQSQSGGAAQGGGTASGGGMATGGDEPKLITSNEKSFWQTATPTEVTSGTADVTVNDTAAQTFTGFGGAFNEMSWDALSVLSEADRTRALKLLFDAQDGANFIYGRIPIGANDYSTIADGPYTLADTANDTAMANFSIARDQKRIIPFIKAAKAVNSGIHFWGSPWTPPKWMKDNNAYNRGNMKDDATNLAAYAVYLAKFVEEYAKEGIKIEAIHPQNEPGFPQDYPSCLWTGALMAKFIGKYLGPTFTERNVEASIFVGTMSNSQTDGGVLSAVMNDATAKPFVKGFGLQWGMIDTYGSLALDKSLPIWQTEHKCGNYPWVNGTNQSKAPNDFAYGVETWGLIRDWIKKGVTSYSAWNMVLDTVGKSVDTVRPWAQNALLTVDTSSKKLNITAAYYVFRHISQYVDVGAKVVGTSGGDALAFKNPDGTIVLVMYNSGAAKKATVKLGGKMLQFDMPDKGWATVNWK